MSHSIFYFIFSCPNLQNTSYFYSSVLQISSAAHKRKSTHSIFDSLLAPESIQSRIAFSKEFTLLRRSCILMQSVCSDLPKEPDRGGELTMALFKPTERCACVSAWAESNQESNLSR